MKQNKHVAEVCCSSLILLVMRAVSRPDTPGTNRCTSIKDASTKSRKTDLPLVRTGSYPLVRADMPLISKKRSCLHKKVLTSASEKSPFPKNVRTGQP